MGIPSGPKPSTLPNYLLFSSKRVLAQAVPKVSFSQPGGSKDNMSIMIVFEAKKGQHGTIYSKPEKSPLKLGELGEIPEGTPITYMKSLTDGTMPYVVEALRAAGWTGTSLAALAKGQLDGFGSTECYVVVEISETMQKKNEAGDFVDVWRVDEDGKFQPRMEISFVNPTMRGFKKQASDQDLAKLDDRFAPFLGGRPKPAAAGGGTGGGAGSQPGDDDIPF